jgi:FixJ family two-component response regulator
LPVIAPFVHVVDDDPSVARALKRLLHAWGMRVRTFESGGAFLSALGNRQDVDCLVIDVQMPGMTGREVQERMNRAGMDVPVIFITAHGDDGIEEDALKAGAAGFLRKPFTEEALVGLIRKVLRQRRKSPEGAGGNSGEKTGNQS